MSECESKSECGNGNKSLGIKNKALDATKLWFSVVFGVQSMNALVEKNLRMSEGAAVTENKLSFYSHL